MLLVILTSIGYAADNIQPFDACRFYLKQTREPSLRKEVGEKIEAYRFTMYSYWGGGHYIRITRKDGAYLLNIGKMISSGKNAKWVEIEKIISGEEWDKLQNFVNDNYFKSLPPEDEVMGFDGSDIIFESVKDGSYYYVKRWAPSHETKTRNLEEFMEVYSEFERYIEEIK